VPRPLLPISPLLPLTGALLFGLLLSACDSDGVDGVGQQSPNALYALRTVNGSSLPADLCESTPDGGRFDRIRAHQGSIDLRNGTRAYRRTVMTFENGSGVPFPHPPTEDTLPFLVHGDSIGFDNATNLRHARVRGGELRTEAYYFCNEGDTDTLVYVRQ
jgi:hypothetical protein